MGKFKTTRNKNNQNNMKKWLSKICFHDYKFVKRQRSKRTFYGYGGGSPGDREIYKCKKCDKQTFTSTNLFVPYSDLKKDYLWKD